MNSQHKIFALVDCNNFFVSCERIFRPELEGKPVVVLSSNDGCVVSRSNEAKRLGIPMGAPAFKYRQIFQAKSVTQFSANFELYGDISRRITSILVSVSPRTEVYSIDESFMDLSALGISNYTAWGRELRAHILSLTGVPVSIGIAPTKTLAKLAADYAKTDDSLSGALSLVNLNQQEFEAYLANFPLEDVWGIGRRLAPKLRGEGIHTALALSQLSSKRARQLMRLSGLQMVSELNGLSCHTLTPLHTPSKTIMRSRTFGEDTHQQHVLQSAIASLATRAAAEARMQNLSAQKVILFLSTSRHKPGFQAWYEIVNLDMPTADSGCIIQALTRRLNVIYNPHKSYHRAGITLYDFVPAGWLQTDLLGAIQPAEHTRSHARMQALDTINSRFGRHRIYYAAEDLSQSWQPKHSLRSPHYVSSWSELPETYTN